VREKETKYNIVEQKMFEHLAVRNGLESENKTLRLANSIEKIGNNTNNNIQIQNLVINVRTEYDDQIKQLTSNLNDICGKYYTLVNIDLESRYKKIFYEKNELTVN
jgi:hypothetical protein